MGAAEWYEDNEFRAQKNQDRVEIMGGEESKR